MSNPRLTLFLMETRFPALARYSLEQSLSRFKFDSVVVATVNNFRKWFRDFDVVCVDHISSVSDYSRFMIYNLPNLIPRDSFVIVQQWDSWVVNGSYWDDDFFNYDYIGAPWPSQGALSLGGNGGFSLRSPALLGSLWRVPTYQAHPEDVAISKFCQRSGHLKLAPRSIAARFSSERPLTAGEVKSFGFHGLFNMGRVMSDNEIVVYLKKLPQGLIHSKEFAELVGYLNKHGRGHVFFANNQTEEI